MQYYVERNTEVTYSELQKDGKKIGEFTRESSAIVEIYELRSEYYSVMDTEPEYDGDEVIESMGVVQWLECILSGVRDK